VQTNKPEMLQPKAFYEHTMQQNATAPNFETGGAYCTPPDSSCFNGAMARQKKGRKKGGNRMR